MYFIMLAIIYHKISEKIQVFMQHVVLGFFFWGKKTKQTKKQHFDANEEK